MIKHVLAVLVLALTLGFAASLGTSTGRSAEAASNPTITTDSSVSADQCTSTQTGYGSYGSYGGYGSYGAYGGYGSYGGYGYGGAYGMPYGGLYQPLIQSPNYGQVYTVYSCNQTQCQPVPYYTTFVVCPGPPAGITVAGPSTSTCASAENITATVLDANGLKVADGTEVDFTTTFGMITAVTQTQDGSATAALNTPTKQTGTAVISVKSANASAGTTISVSCNAPGTFAGGQAQTQQYVAPSAPVQQSSGPSYYGYGY